MDKKYNDLIGDILENSGEKDNYTGVGKGKPLSKSYNKRDILQNFQEKAKEAGFLPPWLKLQKKKYKSVEKSKSLSKSYNIRDILQNFQEKTKDAGFLPPWLKLQKEIVELVNSVETENDIKTINKKIKKYNTMCPAPIQKSPI